MPSVAQQIADAFASQIQTQNQFTKVLPYESIVNENLINQFAQSQAMPEANRLKWTGMYNDLVSQSKAGTLNSGYGQRQQNDLADNYSRYAKDLTQSFYAPAKQNLGNYYNDLYKEYYQDPNAFQYNPVSLADTMKSYNQPFAQ